MTAQEARVNSLWNSLPYTVKDSINDAVAQGKDYAIFTLESSYHKTVKIILERLGYAVKTNNNKIKIIW